MARFIPKIIGLTGKAGAGKDTVAEYLSREYGYVRYSLADPIKDLLNARFGWSPTYWESREWKEAPWPAHGSDQTFLIPRPFSPRSWAQWLGTEVGRTLAGPDVWVNALFAKAASEGNYGCMVIPDVRFNNEAEAVQKKGGIVINVWRDVPAVEGHVSERGVDDLYIDYEIRNSGTKEQAWAHAKKILDGWEKDFGRARA